MTVLAVEVTVPAAVVAWEVPVVVAGEVQLEAEVTERVELR